MKFIILAFILTTHFGIINAQYILEFDVGYSDYLFSNKTGKDEVYVKEVLDGFVNFNSRFSWKVTVDKQVINNKFIGLVGLSVYDVGAENSFYEKWNNTYAGIHLGVRYNIQKFAFGLNTTPAVKLSSSLRIATTGVFGKQKPTLNIDVSPSVSYSINEKFVTNLHFSYGLNDALKTGDGINYKIHALRIGLGYKFKKR